MTNVVTLEGYTPARRYDSTPWIAATIEESTSATGPWTLIDTITLSPVDADPRNPKTRSFTTTNAALTNGWYRVAFKDAATHTQYADPVSLAVGLISLERLKDALDIAENNTSQDDKLARAIASASTAIINYTERKFASPVVTETRNYLYDGSGALEIDDATAVTSVIVRYPNATPLTLTGLQWFAEPVERPLGVYTWLVLPQVDAYGGPVSREMGFTYNLDTYDGRMVTQPTTVDVAATFGWPLVPEDVQWATELTAVSISREHSSDEASEGIEGYNRSWFPPTQGGVRQEAIPQKAKDLLATYVRVVA